jgi:two-component system chemotaxis response regulator CheB
MHRNIVVIGASAGGLDALRAILARLPEDFDAAVCAVLHISPDSPGILADILGRAGPLPAVMVRGRERLAPRTIYVPAPDHHLIVEPGIVRATRGPKENRFRPAIDPLFRSAAQSYGPRAIGAILTGALDDGTAGLWAVKQMGGITIVQDPDDAVAPSMPRSALDHVKVDHCVALARVPELLVKLVKEDIAQEGGYAVPDPIKIEVKIAAEDEPLAAGIERLGQPSTFACPECHGVLREVKEGGRKRYRCHTGHAYAAESLLLAIDEGVEAALWGSVRALHEKTFLLRQLAEEARDRDAGFADLLLRRAEESDERAELVRRAASQEGEADSAVLRAVSG